VGVFVNHDRETIKKIAKQAKLDLIQLHGPYSVEDCRELGASRIIKVLWPDSYDNKKSFLNDLKKYCGACRYFLFDAGKKGGGHGKEISALDYLKIIPKHIKWLMAGGISPDNIETLAKEISPTGWDVNSGVEISPGKKDQKLILNVLKKIKEMR
jgi:phosphoribosylanthranilate isomerase